MKIAEAVGVRRGMTVADLACGSGFFTIPLATLVGKDGLVHAVDADPRMLGHLRTNLEKSKVHSTSVKITRAGVSKTGIRARSVDVAIFVDVLHDLNDKEAFLREVKRICKPEAYVADVDWKRTQMDFGPPLDIRLSEAESRRILQENGFTVPKSIDAGQYHYGLVSRPRGR